VRGSWHISAENSLRGCHWRTCLYSAAYLPVALEVQRRQRSKEAQLAGQGARYPEVGQVPAHGMGKDWGVNSNCARCGSATAKCSAVAPGLEHSCTLQGCCELQGSFNPGLIEQ
jgi:hypothetical protein